MVYILLWLFLGLVGYCLLAYRDIINMILEVESNKVFESDTEVSFKLSMPPTKGEYMKGMIFALALGPLAIAWFLYTKDE